MEPHPSWNPLFAQYEFDLDFYSGPIPVYPPREQIFRAFSTPLADIKLVLLGQDPYHGPGQAHGLAFSVPPGIAKPPSLYNILKEITNEFPERNYQFGPSGSLEAWASRGIFLLNSALTVEAGRAGSHLDVWEGFTDDVIEYIATHNPNCIFLLLGNYAKQKAALPALADKKERIVFGVHPSPLSAHRGFFGSGIFREVERRLGEPIDWNT